MPPRRAYSGNGYKLKKAYKPAKRRVAYYTREKAIEAGLKLGERLVKLDNKFKTMRYIPKKLVDAYNRMHQEHINLRDHVKQLDYEAMHSDL